MKDLYLKFESEEQAQEVLFAMKEEFVQNEDGESTIVFSIDLNAPRYANIDTIGTIYNDDAVINEDGEITTPATAIGGWHVNVRLVSGEDGDALQPYVISVNSPMRVWG